MKPGRLREELRQARRELVRKDRRLALQERRIANLQALLARRHPGEEGYGVEQENVVWIFGSGRTGSTWLSMMMGELPKCARWNEPNVGHLFGHLYYQESLHGREARDTFVLADGFRETWLSSLRGFVLEGATARYPEAAEPGWCVVIKEPHGSVGAPLLMEALPESRMVFLVRDPRDVAASALHVTWARKTPVPRADRMIMAAERPDEFVAQRAETYLQHIKLTKLAYEAHGGPKVLVRYEDLKADTLAEMKRVYSDLELPADEEELARAVEKHTLEKIPEVKKGPGTVRRQGTSGGWREDLTPAQADMVESITAPILEEYYGLARETPATSRVDIEQLRRAYDNRDVGLMVSFYTDDAQLRIVNQLHPPSDPYELLGKEQIARFHRRMFAQTRKYDLEREIGEKDRVSFYVSREYTDGERLLATTVLELDREGRIARHLEVQGPDE